MTSVSTLLLLFVGGFNKARDVIVHLNEKKIMNSNSFEWMSQLRYYWNYDDTGNKIVYFKQN